MSTFTRPTAHMAVIVLSNEDERGLSDPRSVKDANDQALLQTFPLETNDLPATFLAAFQTQYPSKTLAVHSIIVKPGDSACLSSETHPAQYIVAKEGYTYQSLSDSTGGLSLSICDSNYTANLKAISNAIQADALALKLQCRPINDQYKLSYSPQPAVTPTVTPDWDNLQLKFSPLPAGTKVSLSYDCKTN